MLHKVFWAVLIVLNLFATPVFAEGAGGIQFSQLLLTIAIVLGILSLIYVFVLSSKMKGGDLGASMRLYGFGMLSVVVSLLSVTWLKSVLAGIAGTAHDLFFIMGFILMVFGSKKIAGLFASS